MTVSLTFITSTERFPKEYVSRNQSPNDKNKKESHKNLTKLDRWIFFYRQCYWSRVNEKMIFFASRSEFEQPYNEFWILGKTRWLWAVFLTTRRHNSFGILRVNAHHGSRTVTFVDICSTRPKHWENIATYYRLGPSYNEVVEEPL